MKHVCDCGSQNGLAALGPLVEVVLLPHPLVRSQFIATGSMPRAVVKMMVDTGADRTVVERTTAEGMGLTPISYVPMVGVSQVPELCPVYLISIGLGAQDDRGRVAQVEFAAEIIGMNSPQVARQHVGLLGRDFLRSLHLVYNGPKGRVELHLSSEITGGQTFVRKRAGAKPKKKPR